MTALIQPIAIETPETHEPTADVTLDGGLPLTGNFVTVYVNPDRNGQPRFSTNNAAPWYYYLTWQSTSNYALFITFVLPAGLEFGASGTTRKPWPWFSPVYAAGPSYQQYCCVPWVNVQLRFHFTYTDSDGTGDPQIVVTPA